MRRDDADRHGRAADALIASYLRELSSDEQLLASELSTEPQPATEAPAIPLPPSAPADVTLHARV